MSVLKLKQNGKWVPISVGAQGIQGPAGADGADGYTPVRGTDYWTDTDKAEIIQSTKDSISIPTKTSQLENDSGFLTQHQKLKTINGQLFVARLKFTDMSDDFKITYGIGSLTAWVGDEKVNTFLYGTEGQYWHPEDGVVYDLVSSYEVSEPSGQYMYKAIGSFTVEVLDMYYMTPQSANICGETYDGAYFRGTMPFSGINVKFNNDYAKINTSRTGLGIPKYYNYTDSNGNVHIYNGSAWKQMT